MWTIYSAHNYLVMSFESIKILRSLIRICRECLSPTIITSYSVIMLEQPFLKAKKIWQDHVIWGEQNYPHFYFVLLGCLLLFSSWAPRSSIAICFPLVWRLNCHDLFVWEVNSQWGIIGYEMNLYDVCKCLSFYGFLGYVLDIILLEQYLPFFLIDHLL